MNRLRITLIFLGLLCAACDRDDQAIRVYSAPKEAPPSTQAVPPTPDVAFAPTSADEIRWTAPPSWKVMPGGSMRFAAFEISADHPDAMMTVVALGAESGDVLANINRWRGQLKLPAVTAADVASLARQIKIANEPATFVDFTNAGQRMLAVMAPHGGKVWFFKMSGPAQLIDAEKDNFAKFCESIQFTDSPALTESLPAISTTVPSDDFDFVAPTDWQREPAKPMREMSFNLPNGVEVLISKFPAAASGTFLDNVNRWRNQVNLPAVNAPGAQPSTPAKIGSLPAMQFDMTGPDKRMLVAITPRGQDFWYFKLIGPSGAVEAQIKPFETFLESIHFAGDAADATH